MKKNVWFGWTLIFKFSIIMYRFQHIRHEYITGNEEAWALSNICVNKIFDMSHTVRDISYVIQNAVYCNARFVADIFFINIRCGSSVLLAIAVAFEIQPQGIVWFLERDPKNVRKYPLIIEDSATSTFSMDFFQWSCEVLWHRMPNTNKNS